MSIHDQEPVRLAEGDTLDGGERALAAAFSVARSTSTPGAAAVRVSVNAALARYQSRRPRMVVAVVTIALLLGSAGMVAGARILRMYRKSPAPVVLAPVSEVAPVRRASAPTQIAARQPQIYAAAPEEPAPVTQVKKPSGVHRPPTPPAVVEPPPPAPPVPAGEARILADVFRLLRVERNATAALDRLVEFQREFPDATLQVEARLARVEALIALDRTKDALSELDGLHPGSRRLARMAAVTRAELLARQGDCTRAVSVFDDVIEAAAMDEFDERALNGRAACRARTGQVEPARQDLEKYLQRYPGGRFADSVRQQLAR